MIWLAGACLLVAAIYVVYWPRPKGGVALPLWRQLVLRWGHSAVWVILALSFLLRTAESETVAAQANALALAGGLLYVAFMAVTFSERRR